MPIITRKFEFDAGHRVLGHEGKCKHLHGHRYVAEVTVKSDVLDKLGRVIDFGVLKESIGDFIDEHWDHNLILNSEDPLLMVHSQISPELWLDITGGKKPCLFLHTNPTAENIAQVLYTKCMELLPDNIDIIHVRIHETPNCFADYP